MRVWLEDNEITGLCTRVIVDKNMDAAGAEARVRAVCAPEDSKLPRIEPNCGDRLTVEDEGTVVFFGRAENVRYDASALLLEIECLDPAARLTKSECRSAYRGTAAEITRQICRECGLETGTVWENGAETRLPACAGRSAFHAIRRLYDGACVVDFENGAVVVRPKGLCRGRLQSGRLYGLSARNVESAAGGVVREARLTVTGKSTVRCGEIVEPDKPMMGVYGTYQVAQVRQKWEKGLATTELGMVSV
ncbi:MAG: hypothetical protein IK141_06740 [Clostridia bacterium]|nr:hypothetical protein [Clostridia bacterium]